MSENQDNQTSRREFLRNAAVTVSAGVAATTLSSMPTTAHAMARIRGANDRLLIGHVGLGGQGMTHVRLLRDNANEGLKNNTESIAVCDLYVRRKKGAQNFLGLKDNQTYDDYRKLVENKDLDAVWVTTSDNWHAPVALAAMEAGKHVYIEKPMCKTLEEAFALHDTAKRTGKIVQVGSQGCSDEKWHVAGRVVKSGRIGKLVMAQGSYCRNSKGGEWNYYTIDKDAGPTSTGDGYVNWEMFRRGQGPKEWDPDRFFRWRKYWAYGTGIMGDLFPHRLHPLMIAMAQPQDGYDGFPIRVASLGGIYVQKINPETGKPDREVPDFTNIIVDFPNDCSLMLLGTVINEQGWQDMIRGNKATLYFGGSGVEIKPERVWSDEVEGGTEPVNGPGEDIAVHERNFIDSIRNNTVPNCNIDLAVRVQTMISLGEMAYRQGKTMHFDPKTRKAWG
ncbi:MAG TPA: Gfo/Idh/MocA family oxidoreductase [Chthonomonadaceae bacterium]|nr:Gfo/Idh/MocA family oxidoreductase [Chthonomonadaceae bacterium]